jgi:hypothetical protein
MAQLFHDVLGIDVSTGALATMVQEAGGGLGLFLDTTREQLQDAPSVNFDETGARVAGRLHWVHDASNGLLTLLDCHERRGTVAMEDLGVISKMSGIAVHDGWRPYRRYDVAHQLCNAHYAERGIMRKLLRWRPVFPVRAALARPLVLTGSA